MSLTTKISRNDCYAARDTFWDCFRSRDSPSEACSAEFADVEAKCPKSWARMFRGKALREAHDTKSEKVVNKYNEHLRQSEQESKGS